MTSTTKLDADLVELGPEGFDLRDGMSQFAFLVGKQFL